jgi:histidine triad (HIT) family protein
METIFSKILRKEIPAAVVYEDEQVLAFRDIHPLAPVHIVIIPKKEIVSLATAEAADEALLGHLLLVAQQIAKQEGIAESGYRVVTNAGTEGGQEVQHLHFHLLGGKQLGSKLG